MADIPGEADLRAEDIDKIVKNYALEMFTGRQICSIVPTSSEKNTYYQEAITVVMICDPRIGQPVGVNANFVSAT